MEPNKKASMSVDGFINDLVATTPSQQLSYSDQFKLVLSVGTVVTAGLFVLIFSIRWNILFFQSSPNWPQWILGFKLMFGIALAGFAFTHLKLAAQPYSHKKIKRKGLAYLIPFISLIIVFLSIESSEPNDIVITNMMPSLIAFDCAASLFLLGLPLLGGFLYALRSAMPSAPAIAGFYAGLGAGSIAVMIYGFHCPVDSVAFALIWYSIAVLMLAIIGYFIGRTLLKW